MTLLKYLYRNVTTLKFLVPLELFINSNFSYISDRVSLNLRKARFVINGNMLVTLLPRLFTYQLFKKKHPCVFAHKQNYFDQYILELCIS